MTAAIARDEEPSGGFQSSQALPASTQAGAGLPLRRPRIHHDDLRPLKRTTPAAEFLAFIEARFVSGCGVALRAVKEFARQYLKLEEGDGVGYCRRRLSEWARRIGYSARHTHRIISALEGWGALSVSGTRVTTDSGDFWRAANICIANLDASPPPLLLADVAARSRDAARGFHSSR